jgi:hypothetical protein
MDDPIDILHAQVFHALEFEFYTGLLGITG